MTTHFALKLIASGTLLIGAGSVFGQHMHQPAHNASPYAGQQTREIKALSSTQTADLLAGKGMELAKAAELNGYPGPMHTLELATQLELSTEQKQAFLASQFQAQRYHYRTYFPGCAFDVIVTN